MGLNDKMKASTNIPDANQNDSTIDQNVLSDTDLTTKTDVGNIATGMSDQSAPAVQAMRQLAAERTGFPGVVESGLTGMGVGALAGGGASNPVAAAMSGYVAGLQVPSQIYAKKQAQLKSALDAAPLSATYPELAKRYDVFAGMPTGIALPMIQQIGKDSVDLYTKKQEIQKQAEEQAKLQEITPDNALAYKQAVSLVMGSDVADTLDTKDEDGNIMQQGGKLVGMKASELADYMRDYAAINAATGGNVTMTPGAIDQAAQQYITGGKLVTLGMGKDAVANKTAILNRVHELSGGSNLAVNQAAYSANKGALAKLMTQAAQINSFEETALGNLKMVESLSKQLNRSSIPLINDALMKGKTSITGDPIASQFLNAVQTTSTEYAKVMSGATGGAAVTDSAQKEAQKLINTGMNPAQISAVANTMRQEMSNRKNALQQQINTAKDNLTTIQTNISKDTNNAQANTQGSARADTQPVKRIWRH